MDRNVIITGFMGTGKTSVGRILAERLGVPFLDMDVLIEERIGLTVAEIFSCYGEPFFRHQENLVALELSQSAGRVIATGGGTLICDGNRLALSRSGTVINLTCDAAEILRRLHHQGDRPLLMGPDRLGRIEALLEMRRPYYAMIPLQVDTTCCTVEEVVDRILDVLGEKGI